MKRPWYTLLKFIAFVVLISLKSGETELEMYLIKAANAPLRLEPVLRSIVNYGIFLLGLNLGVSVLKYFYRRRKKIPLHRTDNVLSGIENISIIVSALATVVLVMSFFGIDPKSLLTGLSIVAAAIAIITKEYITNIIGGIAISFSDEISIGDYIKMEPYKGRVTDLTITRIALLTNDDEIVYIPHTKIFTSEVVNYTKSGIRRVSIEFEIGIGVINTVETFEHDLIENISEYHQYIEPGSFWLKIQDIHKDNVAMKFQFVLKSINRQLEMEIRKKTVRSIVNHIRRHQV
ncbi:MAG: mechanosensitive ion channel family protein [Saprospiraceae bacterium]